MTTRTARLFALILVSLAACGDDGNALNAMCGDGTREGAEQCDDGNTASGDGCSSSCTTELSMSCGNGATEGSEQCDDGNAMNGDGCSSTCMTESPSGCGNGTITAPETCDDSNTTSGDGCSSTCQTETPSGCGNGTITAPETCDDSNTTSGDGCSSTCQTETPAECGNGVIVTGETCDDDGIAAGDGCSATCQTEPGYTCTGTPSTCTAVTPAGTCAAPFVVNLTTAAGVLSGTGTGNTTASTNQVAAAICNGIDATTGAGKDHVWRFTTTDTRDISIAIASTTTVDTVLRVLAVPCDPSMDVDEFTGEDGCEDNTISGEDIEYTALPAGTYYVVIDGYDAAEAGAYSFTVTARPTLCGNGTLDPVSTLPSSDDEFCDDGDNMGGDGCNARCEEEPGFTCNAAEPSVCTQTCGNSVVDANETCDDGGTVSGNGCSAVCQTEVGYTCTGAPSTCVLTCGNGVVNSGETCDDGGATSGNGCSATCQTEAGYTCTGAPSTCVLTCGNGVLNSGETCDDGGTTSGNGCSATCQTEPGYTCLGMPSTCTLTCGDGTLQTLEECEDGNIINGDRCSSTCTLEFDVAETEPGNNTTPQALTAGDHIIKGALTAGDVDLYTFTLTSPRIVHLETYDRMDNITPNNYTGLGLDDSLDCYAADTVVRLFPMGISPTLDAMALATDDDDGDEDCSYVGIFDGADNGVTNPNEGMLPAGTYTIKVTAFSSTGTAARYLLDLFIEPALTPIANELVINEIMAADNTSDTNCDGSTLDQADEFVEYVNVGDFTLNLGGVTISEANTPTVPRHTFAAGTTVNPGGAIVVWGGGGPVCVGVANFAVASAGNLSLNDTGDTVTVATGGATPVLITSKAFTDAEAADNVSLNRSPDITGTVFALHTAVAGAVGAFSPGKLSDGSAF